MIRSRCLWRASPEGKGSHCYTLSGETKILLVIHSHCYTHSGETVLHMQPCYTLLGSLTKMLLIV